MNWPSDVARALVRRLGDLSPSCKEATRLQSAALDRKLTVRERLGLGVHLLVCKWCRCYGKQIKFLRLAAKEHSQDGRNPSPQALSSEARERIRVMLQSNKE
jgi:hypothetical protein